MPAAAIRASTSVIIALCATALPAQAQWHGGAELGGAVVSQSTFPPRIAATARASIARDADRGFLGGATTLTIPISERTRVHAMVGGALRTPLSRPHGVELSGSGSTYDGGAFPRAISGFGALHGRTTLSRFTLRAGDGAGQLDDGVNTYPIATVDAMATTQWRRVRLEGSTMFHATEGEPRDAVVAAPLPGISVRDRVSYTDVALAASTVRGRLELAMRGGTRVVHRTIATERRPGPRPFGSIDTAWWITPRAALTFSTGRELSDLARGLPDAQYASVAARLRWSGRAGAPPSRHAARGAAPDVVLEHRAGGGAILRVLAGAGAQRVEVAGTFTEWEPVLMTADGNGAWSLATPLAPGPHRLVVRIDGGAWQPPANLPSLDDELGARVGLVTVP